MHESEWTFLTNHSHVLLCLATDPDMRLRDVAQAVGITERAAHRIVHELREAGFVAVEKEGRRNRYRVRGDMPLRHPLEAHRNVGDILRILTSSKRKRAS